MYQSAIYGHLKYHFGSSLVYFHSFEQQIVHVEFSGIRTRIVGMHADHQSLKISVQLFLQFMSLFSLLEADAFYKLLFNKYQVA